MNKCRLIACHRESSPHDRLCEEHKQVVKVEREFKTVLSRLLTAIDYVEILVSRTHVYEGAEAIIPPESRERVNVMYTQMRDAAEWLSFRDFEVNP